MKHLIFSLLLLLLGITSPIQHLNSMPKADGVQEDFPEEESEDSAPPDIPEETTSQESPASSASNSNAEQSSTGNAGPPNTKNSQFKTLELEGVSNKQIVSTSDKKTLEELSSIFDAASQIHKEIISTISSIEQSQTNLTNSFHEAESKLDPILQETSFTLGERSNHTISKSLTKKTEK